MTYGRPPDVLSVENTTPNWRRQIYEDLFHRPLWANPTTQSTVGQIGGRILYSIVDAFYVSGTNLFGRGYHFDGRRSISSEVTDAGLSVLADVVLVGSGSALKATKSAGKSVDEIIGAADDVAKGSVKAFPRSVNASWGKVFKYRHGGNMSAIEHIMYRHSYNSGFNDVSRFSKGKTVKMIKGYVDEALK